MTATVKILSCKTSNMGGDFDATVRLGARTYRVTLVRDRINGGLKAYGDSLDLWCSWNSPTRQPTRDEQDEIIATVTRYWAEPLHFF